MNRTVNVSRYVERNLLDGEQVLDRTSSHPLPALLPGTLVFLLAVVVMAMAVRPVPLGILSGAAAGLLLSTPLFLYYGVSRYWGSEYVVTDRRMIGKSGLFFKTSMEMNLTKAETVILTGGPVSEHLDYGTLVIGGTGGSKTLVPKRPAGP